MTPPRSSFSGFGLTSGVVSLHHLSCLCVVAGCLMLGLQCEVQLSRLHEGITGSYIYIIIIQSRQTHAIRMDHGQSHDPHTPVQSHCIDKHSPLVLLATLKAFAALTYKSAASSSLAALLHAMHKERIHTVLTTASATNTPQCIPLEFVQGNSMNH